MLSVRGRGSLLRKRKKKMMIYLEFENKKTVNLEEEKREEGG